MRRVWWTLGLVALLLGLGLLRPVGAAALEPAPAGSFSVVVIPDTQAYRTAAGKAAQADDTDLTNRLLENHVRWIVANLTAQQIVFVSHVGDLVDLNREAQWAVARRCLEPLHGLVPYGLSVGNHDTTAAGDSSLFQQHFGAERFRQLAWYGGCYAGDPERPGHSGNNANSYQLFSAGGLDFVHLNLECNAPDDVLRWADGILDQHAARRALVTTHQDLGPREQPAVDEDYFRLPKGRMTWKKVHGARGNTPQQMWDKCFAKHANLGLIFSGDQRRTTAAYLTSTGVAGNVVHALMSDYTSSGPLRVYRFLPAANTIQVITYDTTRGELTESTASVPEREQHQFTLPYPLRPAA